MGTELETADWDVEVDVAVVGFGGAGACAAVEAAENGAAVLVTERFSGGGATALSGGVVYAGGGTEYQKRAGFDDSPEAMFAYLKEETRGIVSDETLMRFCEGSVGDLAWLEGMGVPFDSSCCPFKTSYPTDDYFLYYSGNESVEPYRSVAAPAPRGHRTKASGRPGKRLFRSLRDRARELGVDLRCRTNARRLVTDGEGGRVTGVECGALAPGSPSALVHALLWWLHCKTIIYVPPIGKFLARLLAYVENRWARPFRVRARKGVVLAAGGFIMNRSMVREHAPQCFAGLTLGTAGDDGRGIRLGVEAGGATWNLSRVSAWRFYNPPEAFVRGILVDQEGRRICNEALYGAAVGRHIVEEHGGKAYLILDSDLWRRGLKQIFAQTVAFQRLQALYIFSLGHRRARSLAGLAGKTGIDPALLEATIAEYNEMAQSGVDDPMGKPREYVQPLRGPRFYSVDCSLDTWHFFPCPLLTLGGLVVDEQSGQVKRTDGSRIEGLYAAGRNALGVCSESYVSGLSIADCVFSGRRAGRHAANDGESSG